MRTSSGPSGEVSDVLGARSAGGFRGSALWALAFVVLGITLIGLGLLLSHVLVPSGLDRGRLVERLVRAPADTALNEVTRFGSALGSTPVILAVGGVIAVVFAIARLRAPLLFLFFALTLEFGLFILTTLIIDRHRPTVPRLDGAPPTSSFPSGHTASALTLYVGLAIVASTLVRSALQRVLVWMAAVLLPIVVGISRVYRGMHFPTDVAASVLLAAGALLFALLAVRSMAAAEADRDDHEETPPEPRQEVSP